MPLGFVEYKSALTLEYQDDKIVTVTWMNGNLDNIIFKQACKYIFTKNQQLQTILQCKNDEYDIVYDKDKVSFSNIWQKEQKLADLSLNTIQDIVQQKLKEKFNLEEALWKINLLIGINNSYCLLLEFHHTMIDGIASANLVHQILKTYTQLKTGALLDIPYKPLLSKTPAECFPHRNALTFANYTSKINESLKDELGNLPKPIPFQSKAFIPLAERETKEILVSFTLAPLKKLANSYGVKINGLLSALFILSMFEYKKANNELPDITLSTCVDLRRYCSLESNDIASIYNAVTNRFKDTDFKEEINHQNFGKFVKHIEDKINLHITEFAQPPQFPICKKIETIKQYLEIEEQAAKSSSFPSCIAASNLGKLAIKNWYGEDENKINVQAYFLYVSQVLGFAEILPNIATLDDKVFINFTYVYPLHSDNWALDYVKHFIKNMEIFAQGFELIQSWTSEHIVKANNIMRSDKNSIQVLAQTNFGSPITHHTTENLSDMTDDANHQHLLKDFLKI